MTAFATSCTALNIDPPAALARGLDLKRTAEAHISAPRPRNLLTMTDKELRTHITELSIRDHDRDGRGSGRGMRPGVDIVTGRLLQEVRDASAPDLERITEDLRPRFDEHAEPLMRAAQQYGFTYQTTSDDVINLADEGAAAAWRDVRAAWSAIAPLAALRIHMSDAFDVAPFPADRAPRVLSAGEPTAAQVFPISRHLPKTNHSISFAAGRNWSNRDGYYIDGKTAGHLDWLALAAGGLRLNSPAEVAAKLEAQ